MTRSQLPQHHARAARFVGDRRSQLPPHASLPECAHGRTRACRGCACASRSPSARPRSGSRHGAGAPAHNSQAQASLEKLPASCTPHGASGDSSIGPVWASSMRRSVPRRNAATKMRHRVGGLPGLVWAGAPSRASLAQSSAVRPVMSERSCASRPAACPGSQATPPPAPARHCEGRGRKPRVAEALTQVRQQFRRFRDRLLGIERIGKPALGRRSRHELRNALRARAAGDARPEAALLPDQPGEEIDRQVVRCGCALDHAAQRLIDGFAHWLGRRRSRYAKRNDQRE